MKLAIITGASSGIGAASAELFIHNGFTVVNISRRESQLPNIINITCNLADTSQIKSALQKLIPLMQEATEVCLVHNACKISGDSADHCDLPALNESLQINLIAPTQLNQALLPLMHQGSSVIYIGSTLSEKAVANAYSYVISKHATIGMMRATCQDMVGKHIHTACICPGFTDTEMLRSHISDDDARQQIGANNAFSRLIQANEIADMIFWAHQHPVINGSIIHGNLGQIER